jgi:hypothetical protein
MYGDQFAKMTKGIFPIAIVLHQMFGLWLLSASNKTALPGLADRLKQHYVWPGFVLLFAYLAYLVSP